MVKAVQSGSVGAAAGLQPFDVLSVINGRSADSNTTTYERVIALLRGARPLHLSFAGEKAALRATVTFVSPGPLGLQLEPVTGNPVRLLSPLSLARALFLSVCVSVRACPCVRVRTSYLSRPRAWLSVRLG
jgi:hypothetical protein